VTDEATRSALLRLNPRVLTPPNDWLDAREWTEAGVTPGPDAGDLDPLALKFAAPHDDEWSALAAGAERHGVVLRRGRQGAVEPVLLAGARGAVRALIADLAAAGGGEAAAALAATIEAADRRAFTLDLAGREVPLGATPLVVGVVNVTPDSFSDGGRFLDRDVAVSHGLALTEAGADLIDVGGESTRPSAAPVSEQDELDRVAPVIEGLVTAGAAPVSIDTAKAGVARAAVAAGAVMVNDVTALFGDDRMAETVAALDVPVCVMHMQGTPRTMQRHPRYDDLMGEIVLFLRRSMARGAAAGVPESRFLVDPGIGFGKTVPHNLAILRRLGQVRSLGRPILVGTSRKSFIGAVLGGAGEPRPVAERLLGTAATVAAAVMNGAHIVRVHDAAEMRDVVRLVRAIADETDENGQAHAAPTH